MTNPSPVTLSVSDGIARLELNRPDNANGINLELAAALDHAAGNLAADPSVRVVLLTGAGARFCAGGDVHAFATHEDPPKYIADITARLHPAVLTLAALDAPVVAAVQGSAAGAGLGLVLAADVVIAARSAKFTMAYTGIGCTPDGSASWFLPRIVGHRRAVELTLTNRVLSADEAAAWGIVTTVVDDASLQDAALEIASRLAGGPTLAFGRATRLLRQAADHGLAEHLDLERELLVASAASRDGKEGIAAFSEKRAPSFTGR